jgi:hypothetical protein
MSRYPSLAELHRLDQRRERVRLAADEHNWSDEWVQKMESSTQVLRGHDRQIPRWESRRLRGAAPATDSLKALP